MAAALGCGPRNVCGRARNLRQAQVLRAGDAALPQRPVAHGTRAQLLHWRRARPPHVDARLQRAASHGVGCLWAAGRERRAQAQYPSARVDALEHRRHEGADGAARPGLRLGHRGHHLPARVLPLEPVVLPPHVREGPGLPQKEQGELVPGVRHRAGQRAGGQRLLLAARNHAGGAARPGAVVLSHHRLRPGTARWLGQARRLAGKSPHHAAQLDWAI